MGGREIFKACMTVQVDLIIYLTLLEFVHFRKKMLGPREVRKLIKMSVTQ